MIEDWRDTLKKFRKGDVIRKKFQNYFKSGVAPSIPNKNPHYQNATLPAILLCAALVILIICLYFWLNLKQPVTEKEVIGYKTIIQPEKTIIIHNNTEKIIFENTTKCLKITDVENDKTTWYKCET